MKNKLINLLLATLLLVSCQGQEKEEWIYGIGESLNPSATELAYSVDGGSQTINVDEGRLWWIGAIVINDVTHELANDNDREPFEIEYYSFIDTFNTIATLKSDWFEISRDEDSVVITIDRNTTDSERAFKLNLYNPNFFGDTITINQL